MNNMYNASFAYFIGIGGIGMSALARLLAKQDCRVFGYDQAISPLISVLKNEGIAVHHDDSPEAIPNIIAANPQNTIVVYTPAIPPTQPIMVYLQNAGFTLKSRAEVLGLLSKKMPTIAVAGTHGKTTTAAMLTHMLYQSTLPIMAFVGGIMNLYESNFIHNCPLDQAKLMVAEADEFNKSFLCMSPLHGIITAVDPDHLDTYSTPSHMEDTFRQFIHRNKKKMFIHHKVAEQLQLHKHCPNPFVTYGLHSGDIQAGNLCMTSHHMTFDYLGPTISIRNIAVPIVGWYNLENALAAIAVALELGITQEQLLAAMASFAGIKRRFAIAFENEQCIYIDDYAHHPVELSALLTTVKRLYPQSFITAIFQPHLFSRTLDFSDAFATSLSIANQVFLLPIYPAREMPIPGITSALIFNKLTCKNKALITVPTLPTALTTYKEKRHHVILTIGAGNISEVVPTLTATLKLQYTP